MNYCSNAKQDEFVAKMLNFRTSGFYLDIGSHDGQINNNSYLFEQLGWNGICIEIDPNVTSSYTARRCRFVNQDATKIDYENLLKSAPSIIDYLSLDIDEASLDVLKILPFEFYRFKIITIEHDYYLHGDRYRAEQRKILLSHGYDLVCGNVLVEQPGFEGRRCPFEDWWIAPETFDHNIIEKIRSVDCLPSEIVRKIEV